LVAVAAREPVAVAVAPWVPPVTVAVAAREPVAVATAPVGVTTTEVFVAVGDPPPPVVGVIVAVAIVSTGVGVGVGPDTLGVTVGVSTIPTLTMPFVQVAGTAVPFGELAPWFEQVKGKSPVAPAAILILQVYITTGHAGWVVQSGFVEGPQIGQVLANVSTIALAEPSVWNAKDVACLSMAGFTVQSGFPLFVAIAAIGSNAMLFCVPAISWSAFRLTSTVVVPPAGPCAFPILIVTSAWTREPLTTTKAATTAHLPNILLLLLIFNPPLDSR
jgi:hypothetical protein